MYILHVEKKKGDRKEANCGFTQLSEGGELNCSVAFLLLACDAWVGSMIECSLDPFLSLPTEAGGTHLSALQNKLASRFVRLHVYDAVPLSAFPPLFFSANTKFKFSTAKRPVRSRGIVESYAYRVGLRWAPPRKCPVETTT